MSDNESLDNFIKYNYYISDINPLLKNIFNDVISNDLDITNVKYAFDYVLYKSFAQSLFEINNDIHKLNVIDFEN